VCFIGDFIVNVAGGHNRPRADGIV
jgi:hypothetical protein